MIEARVVLDSISPIGSRLTTFQLRYPKFIHGELMTHRRFSRNASSSRAIPVSKNLEEAMTRELMATPEYWGSEIKGMASGTEVIELRAAQDLWWSAAQHAGHLARQMSELGLHKSIVNRVLEPFLHINVLVSATEYLNFFGLRLDRAAQPEMRVLAERMWAAWNESKPERLVPNQWHRPFIDEDDQIDCLKVVESQTGAQALLNKVSVARCARVSYLSFETGKRSTVTEDLALYERLVGAQPLHASPAEHVATPDDDARYYTDDGGQPVLMSKNYRQWGNFPGWRQLRKTLPGEAIAPLPHGYEVK